MKETKVYVDELPIQCIDCQFAYGGKCQLNGKIYCIENCRRSDCPLIDIKTHNRELVRQVCKEIRKDAYGALYEEGKFDIFSMESILEDIKCKFRFSWRNKQDTKWQKLKEWLSFTQPKNTKDEFISGACAAYSNIVDKMQELEAEDVED